MAERWSVIDADIHPVLDDRRVLDFLPEPWRTRYAGGNRGPGVLGYWNPNGVMRADTVTEDGKRIEADPHRLIEHFIEPFGIEYGIMNPEGSLRFGLSPEPDFGAAVCAAMNDVLINDWLPADPRLRTSLIVSPTDPPKAAQEIHRLGNHPGVAQVIMPSGGQMSYGHRFFHPIYEAAVAQNLPVAIHPGTEGVGISGVPTAAGYPASYLEWHTGLIASYMAHLISLVSEGTFQRFPTLRFVMMEAGALWLPPLLWRFDKNWMGLRQTTPWLDRAPSKIIADHILLTTQPIEEPDASAHFRAMLDMFDVGKMLMFSSDFPHWDGDTPDFAARAFPAALRGRVMSETARELYRLPAKTAATPTQEFAEARHD
ncbi:MAG TPA: amidohydrolase family protein [Thermomicrobiales bacterium]|jgi:predicted TIM-barrel fold metal-dependent hydrolase